MAGASRDPARRTDLVHRARGPGRSARCGARGRTGVRPQPVRAVRAVPSSGPRGRQPRRLPLGAAGQTVAAALGELAEPRPQMTKLACDRRYLPGTFAECPTLPTLPPRAWSVADGFVDGWAADGCATSGASCAICGRTPPRWSGS